MTLVLFCNNRGKFCFASLAYIWFFRPFFNAYDVNIMSYERHKNRIGACVSWLYENFQWPFQRIPQSDDFFNGFCC